MVTGRLSDAEVGALMRRADLFVFPTLADTLPLVVFEAMAQAVPVLASAVGGIPYQIDPGCGQLVPPNDAAALAAAIERLVQDRARLLQDEIAARSASRTNRQLYVLSLLTALFLPATFITGLFGINVKGLPWVESDLGAEFVALSCIAAAVLTLILLRRRGVIGD